MILHYTRKVLLIMLALLLSVLFTNSCSERSFEKPEATDEQQGRAKIMANQENSNIGKRFPEVTAESLAKTCLK